jgi:small GTP-binding protein
MGNSARKKKARKKATLPHKIAPQPKQPEIVKVIMLGDVHVGKSSIKTRFVDNTYEDVMTATIGEDMKVRTLRLKDGTECKVQIWDTGGQERFRTITSSYYRGAHLIILVYDVTCRDSFEHIQQWLGEVDRYASDRALCMVLGNKIDQKVAHKSINAHRLKQWLFGDMAFNGGYASAREDTRIDEVFQNALTQVIVKRRDMVS